MITSFGDFAFTKRARVSIRSERAFYPCKAVLWEKSLKQKCILNKSVFEKRNDAKSKESKKRKKTKNGKKISTKYDASEMRTTTTTDAFLRALAHSEKRRDADAFIGRDASFSDI